MSFIKATIDKVDVVCSCGVCNQRKYSEALITPVAIQFPPCNHCGGRVCTGMTVPEFSEDFAKLEDDQLKRLIIAQVVHKRALDDPGSSVSSRGISKEDLLKKAIRTGQHHFVNETPEVFEAPLPSGMKHARKYSLEHGKPFIATQVALENSDPELLARVDALLGGSSSEDNPQG